MKKRVILVVAAVCCFVVSVMCLAYSCFGNNANTSIKTEQFAPSQTHVNTTTTPKTTVASQPTEPTKPYVSEIDFDGLKQVNDDVYAWIRIQGTKVNYPVVQNPEDDSFYLDHDSDKNENVKGAIFSEHLYNSTDFSDAVTVLYGHNMANGEMFGDFQSMYWDRDVLLENDTIEIFLPDRKLEFEIFAALPYSRMHLLHYYHTEKQNAFNMLVNDIYDSRMFGSVLIEDRKPQFGDQVLILSTCLSGDNRYRYLVIGVLKDNN